MAGEERTSILDDVSELLREDFALEHWGRVLVELARDGAGELRVADVEVEEILGDEKRVEEAFGAPRAPQLMAAIGKAVEALCLLEAVDVEHVHGGTFLRADFEGGPPRVEFLPGLVRVPSRSFERVVPDKMRELAERERAFSERFGLGAGAAVELDLPGGTFRVVLDETPVARGTHVLLGTYSRPHRQWVWGSKNPTVSDEVRRRVTSALDAMPEREAWEISTPAFATDERTAVAVAGWVACESGLTTLLHEAEDGLLVYGLGDVVDLRA